MLDLKWDLLLCYFIWLSCLIFGHSLSITVLYSICPNFLYFLYVHSFSNPQNFQIFFHPLVLFGRAVVRQGGPVVGEIARVGYGKRGSNGSTLDRTDERQGRRAETDPIKTAACRLGGAWMTPNKKQERKAGELGRKRDRLEETVSSISSRISPLRVSCLKALFKTSTVALLNQQLNRKQRCNAGPFG